MRRERRTNGWDEIQTKKINIRRIWRNFSTNESWVDINKRRPGLGRTRKSCKCCDSKWENNGSNISLAFTDKGNKIICNTCTDYFEEQGIEIFEKTEENE